MSFGGWQYVGYWDAERNLALARRELPAGAWQLLRFTDYQIVGQDSHNAVAIGACPNDGTLHLAFDHHGSPLNYRRSIPGLALAPERYAWTPDHFGPVEDELVPSDGTLTKVTYPRFLPTPDGNLQLVYREFSSGNGRLRLVDYSAETGAWSENRVFIERTGAHTDPLGGDSVSRNPYLNRIVYDAEGTLHATWTWREKAPEVYNRDIAYAYSEDGGRRWWNGGHELVADTDQGSAILAATPGVTGVPLGAEWGLMNNQGQAVDERGRVHVVMYYKPEPDDEVGYGSQSVSPYRHHWLDADGVWRESTLPTKGDRCKLLAGPAESLVLVYKAAGGDLAVDLATARADYTDWQRLFLHPAFFGSSAAPDFARFDATGLLSVFFQDQPTFPGEVTPIGVAHVNLHAVAGDLLQSPTDGASVLLAPQADTYVRGGAFSSLSFGDDDRLIVKQDGNDDFDRIAYLRFDVASLASLGPLERVYLELTSPVKGPLSRTTPYAARFVPDDGWNEATLTWDDAPPTAESVAAHFGRTGMRWDVTARAVEAVHGDGLLTFALTSEREGSDRIVHLWSREHTEPSARPRLVVRSAQP